MRGVYISRDSSGRLALDHDGIGSVEYPGLCRALAAEFGLNPVDELIVGPDQVFQDYRRGEQVVGLEWDIWSNFIVVAKTLSAEPLVLEIADWLGKDWRGTLKSA